MKELRKEDVSQEVFNLYDDYAHNRIDRRVFLDKLSMYAVGGVTVSALLSFISPNYNIIQVPAGDPRVKSESINYDSPKGGGSIKGQLARPADAKGELPVRCTNSARRISR